jgi:hypothetical protein
VQICALVLQTTIGCYGSVTGLLNGRQTGQLQREVLSGSICPEAAVALLQKFASPADAISLVGSMLRSAAHCGFGNAC